MVSLIVGILNLCLNFVLIPKIGLIGAGLSTIASFIFQRILTIKKINETTILSYRLLYSNKFEIISILIMTLCSLLVHDNSLEFINITSRILIYIILFMLSFVFLIRKVILVKKIL
jgi:O-antigen/teichoic acid export membrane protein